jgi:hypothetical protein
VVRIHSPRRILTVEPKVERQRLGVVGPAAVRFGVAIALHAASGVAVLAAIDDPRHVVASGAQITDLHEMGLRIVADPRMQHRIENLADLGMEGFSLGERERQGNGPPFSRQAL